MGCASPFWRFSFSYVIQALFEPIFTNSPIPPAKYTGLISAYITYYNFFLLDRSILKMPTLQFGPKTHSLAQNSVCAAK